MPTQFEQQVIANQLAIQDILNNIKTITDLDYIPSSLLGTDVIPVKRPSTNSTYRIRVSDLFTSSDNPSIAPILLGYVPTAGTDTNATELQNHINNIGFTIVAGQIKVIQVVMKVSNTFLVAKYFYKPNQPGIYGNAGTAISFNDLYLMYQSQLDSEDTNTVVIDVGDTGVNNISTHLNTTTASPDWNLLSGNVHIFKGTINGTKSSYLYVGNLPNQLGLGNNMVTENDFELLDKQGWIWVEGSWIQKIGNTNYEALEVGDIVYYKDVIFDSRTITLVGWTYDGGDKTLKTSYTKTKQLA